MALYDGFFDAEKIDPNGLDDPSNYDRTYGSADFVDYFANFIGSGVCVYNNPDSFKVSYSDGSIHVAPGYLFIKGYWLRNDDDLTIQADAGVYAVVARLNSGARMIGLDKEVKSDDYTSDNCLVLAYVTVASSGEATVDDMRSDTDVCGVIDSIGSMSKKLDWALNYIDTEIIAKLSEAEQTIDKHVAALQSKLAEISALADAFEPPDVGTIKFSASQDIGDDWLKCDGSFVSEYDYPELVEALGKLTPGVDDFKELLDTSDAEYISNCCLYDGYAWVYLVKSKKLVGFNGAEKKEIDVTGVDDLVQLASVDTVLSVCGGAVYLAQNNQTASAFVLLECENFTGREESIVMARLSVSNYTSDLDMKLSVPRVVDVSGTKYMVLGTKYTKSGSSEITHTISLTYLSWVSGAFSSANKNTTNLAYYSYQQTTGYGFYEGYSFNLINSYRAFSPKTSMELFIICGYISSRVNYYVNFGVGSFPRKIYGTNTSSALASGDSSNAIIKWVLSLNPKINILPAVGNNEYILRAEIVNRKLTITHGIYNPVSLYDWRTIDIDLPARAVLFKESVCYAATQGLWFVFVGTGLLFTDNLAEGTWGYLDTQETIGVITQFGCVDYDAEKNALYISGVASNGIPKLGEMKLPDLYDYANDGAWLPMIASDGVPAYIKAKPGDGMSEKVDVQINVTISGDFANYADFIFNGETLVSGTYVRKLPQNGKFTVGLHIKHKESRSYYVNVILGSTKIARVSVNSDIGTEQTASFNVSDYISTGISVSCTYTSS